MKKKNLVKKTLLPAIVAVLCSLVALTSVSYAWFSLGNTASVGQIDVNVTAADGIQMSADAASWKSVIPVSELKTGYTDSKNVFPSGAIAPMSSVGEVTEEGYQKMFFGTLQEDGASIVTEQQTEDNAVNFIAFDLFVNLNADKTLYLLEDSSVVQLTGTDTHSEIAVRVSFIKVGHDNEAANVTTALDENLTSVIWEPNALKHISDSGLTDGSKLSYNGVNAASATAFPLDDATYTTAVTTKTEADQVVIDAETGNGIELFDLEAGYTKIRVYIWLEGQDADCLNAISGGGFSVNLQFATNKN